MFLRSFIVFVTTLCLSSVFLPSSLNPNSSFHFFPVAEADEVKNIKDPTLVAEKRGLRPLEMSKEQIYQLATAAAREGHYEVAVEMFQKIISIDPRFSPAYNGLGLVYQSWNGGNFSEAIRYFRLATDVDPAFLESWNNLGKAYYSQANFNLAEKTMQRSLQIKDDQPEIQLALAWVYLLGQSRPDEAVMYFNKALKSHDNVMAHYGLGLAGILNGDRMLVLDQITALRRAGKEKEALHLELMFKEDSKIASIPGMPLVTGKEAEQSAFQKELSTLTGGAVDADNKTQGIQVRLRGSL